MLESDLSKKLPFSDRDTGISLMPLNGVSPDRAVFGDRFFQVLFSLLVLSLFSIADSRDGHDSRQSIQS
ncbi:hypothetical protein IFO70_02775 [Phormidium tenue FACHB-886]|nr:hypothetical protein [Phormidium tenue FACHB-886]